MAKSHFDTPSAKDGKTYNTTFYNLDAIISACYRVNSIRATQFRQWRTYVLRQYAIRGYVIDKSVWKTVRLLEHLLAEIREIGLSVRRFYQKLTDIYATAIDYNKIVERANTSKEHIGPTTWESV